MSANEAKQLQLALPAQAAQGVKHRPTGLDIRSGYLQFRLQGMDQTEYTTSCFFLGLPDAPALAASGPSPRRLLQPLGILKQLRFTFDMDPGEGSPYGTMTVEKK